jgi:hypothetical protein
MQSYWLLKRVVHIVSIGLYRVILHVIKAGHWDITTDFHSYWISWLLWTQTGVWSLIYRKSRNITNKWQIKKCSLKKNLFYEGQTKFIVRLLSKSLKEEITKEMNYPQVRGCRTKDNR